MPDRKLLSAARIAGMVGIGAIMKAAVVEWTEGSGSEMAAKDAEASTVPAVRVEDAIEPFKVIDSVDCTPEGHAGGDERRAELMDVSTVPAVRVEDAIEPFKVIDSVDCTPEGHAGGDERQSSRMSADVAAAASQAAPILASPLDHDALILVVANTSCCCHLCSHRRGEGEAEIVIYSDMGRGSGRGSAMSALNEVLVCLRMERALVGGAMGRADAAPPGTAAGVEVMAAATCSETAAALRATAAESTGPLAGAGVLPVPLLGSIGSIKSSYAHSNRRQRVETSAAKAVPESGSRRGRSGKADELSTAGPPGPDAGADGSKSSGN
ncbi:hypothetical protein K438DRAFT_1781075 [Mycena galopus ATCC 62051]|nr:hypothetical protein K438DRAFT_1781075 [Mycena galopus ATCC 62051]